MKSFIYEHKNVFKNILALSLIQATNFILPLLTVPYIIITVGWLNFGAITFAQSFFSYLLYLTEYGFNITATREISINKDNPNLISNIVDDNVTQAKDDFEAVISAKLASAIEDKKQEVAQSIYVNSEQENTEDETEEDGQEQ